ncbi:SCP-like protein, partial [Ostertagia ostertagi]
QFLQFLTGSCELCPGSTLTEELRTHVLGAHNLYRYFVNDGYNIGPDDTEYPTAKNMYAMRWSCGLERLAREAVEGCPSQKPNNSLYASNILYGTKQRGYKQPEIDNLLQLSFNDFATARSKYQWGNMVLNFQGPEPLRSLANIYRAVTLSVGCSQQTCNDKATAVCFFSKPELRNGQLIYRAGTPCKSDQECTTYPRSTCNVTETLCHAQSFETVPAGANNQCSNNTGMTDSLREKFLKMHNYRRSNMALGKVEKFNGKFFPKAANMEKMEYDCDLEADAMIYAETCALVPSYPGTRKDQGENVAVVEPQSAESFDKAAQWAMRSWFKPIKEDGSIGIKEVTFKEKHRYTPVAGATQVVWSTTNKVG